MSAAAARDDLAAECVSHQRREEGAAEVAGVDVAPEIVRAGAALGEDAPPSAGMTLLGRYPAKVVAG